MTAVIVGDGSDAIVTPVVVNGALSSVTIDAGGQDYTSATITFTTSGGALQYRHMITLVLRARDKERDYPYR
ncbi:MAG: hypothetical protein CM15mV23_0240 [Eurybiavirus sp.]|nr:MAG: hypothetical protein CM15mV23_0240 [Eurybiavirus sp.]